MLRQRHAEREDYQQVQVRVLLHRRPAARRAQPVRAAHARGEGELSARLKDFMDRGALVPDETIIDTLLKAMKGKKGVGAAQQKLIIDGFPRVLSQGLIYESKVSEVYLIVLFNVAKEILFDRMLKRVADTPVEKRRSDDKPEVLENRINTFMNETMKACDFYNRLGRVRVIEAQSNPDTVCFCHSRSSSRPSKRSLRQSSASSEQSAQERPLWPGGSSLTCTTATSTSGSSALPAA